MEAAGVRQLASSLSREQWRRRRWAVAEGREGGSKDSDDGVESPGVLRLVPFSCPLHVNFGTVPVGTSRVRRLALENPNAEPAIVTVCCPQPASKGFIAEQNRCFLQSGERILIPITWTPLEDGAVREVITFVVNDIVKHRAVLLGIAKQLTKKKHFQKSLWDTIKKRTPAQQSRLKKRLPIIKNAHKVLQMPEKPSIDRSPLQSCENVSSNGYSISPNKDPLIMLEKKLSLSPVTPTVQENCHVSYTTPSVRRSATNSASRMESHVELRQDMKGTCTVMSLCGDFMEAKLESACLKPVKTQGSDKDSIFTPEHLQRSLNHRRILSPDSFINNSYELNEEPTAIPILSPDQFLQEIRVAVQATSQEHVSMSVSSSAESCPSATIFPEQEKNMKVVSPYEFPSSKKPFSGLQGNKKRTVRYEKFERKVDESKKSSQIQICNFQKEKIKKRPVLSKTVIKKKPDHPEGKGLDSVKLKSRKCLSNAIQQCVDTESTNLEILPELPVIESISGEGKFHKPRITSGGFGTTLCNRKRKTQGHWDDANIRSEEQEDNLEPKKIFISCKENENGSEISDSNKERHSQKKRPESLSQKWRIRQKNGQKTKKIVPVAQSQLTFVKPLKTGIPRHPMPFVAKNMFYDERWKEKQQRAFTWWLNFVLTPDDFTVKTDISQVDASSLMLGTELCHKASVPRAPTKEEVSLRSYTARCKLNKLRRSAYHLFTSHEMVKAIKRLEIEIEAKRLLIRKDRHLWKDIGERQKILNWLLCYNPLWLRIGLEVVYGELIALESNSDVMGLAMFILGRLLWNPDIAAEYRHPTVPHLYREGHEEALSKFTLKKLLLLVCFLDHAKLSRIIDHDPCLFCKNAQFKSSKELLLAFSRDFLSGEGDLSRHLGFLGFQVHHIQTSLDEFDFSVTNLAVDLQCGIRLVRALELLSSNWNLSKKLRVPAISRLQKMHNVKIALQVLKDRGIDLEDEHGAAIDAKDIVDRHREKTLALLWKIVFAFQVDVLFDMNQLREEIDFLKNMLVRKAKMAGLESSATKNVRKDSSSFYSSKNCSENVKLLMDWVNAVCGFYNVKVENFTVSFSDGRVLCYLIHHYHPCYVPLEAICQRTTLTVECTKSGTVGLNSSSESDASLNLLNETFDQTITASVLYKELLDNEKMNFQLINAAVSDLGGVPAMIHHSDMSNTIPDEKIVITYVSFLCARLLELCKEIRAARLIQSAWRKHRSKTKFVQAVKQKLSATVVIQKHWRRCLAQMKLKKLKEKQEEAERVSSIVIQSNFGAMSTAEADRQRYQNLNTSALVIQSAYRRWKKYKMNLVIVTELQATKRAKEERAAVVIQSWYRMLRVRNSYLHIRCSVIKIQALFRGIQAKGIYEQKKQCVITIQRYYRAYRLGNSERKTYLQKRLAVIVLQSAYRRMKARLLNREVKAACVIQIHYRAYRKQAFQRQRFLQVKKASLCLQAAYRGYRIRKMLKRQNEAAVKIQSTFKTYIAVKKYQALMQASLVLQRWYRASKTRRKYLRTKAAVTSLQAAFRGWQVRKRIWTQHAAAVIVQSAFRRYTALKRFRMMRSAAKTLQHHYRSSISGKRQRQKYIALRHSIIQLQAVWRGTVVRKQIQRQNQAAVVIQSYFRMRACQRKFESFRRAVLRIQSVFRGMKTRLHLREMHTAAIIIQRQFRTHLHRRNFVNLKTAAVIIQRKYRATMFAKKQREEYLSLRKAVVIMQSSFRGLLVRKYVKRMQAAAVIIQAAFRRYRDYSRYQAIKLATISVQLYYKSYQKTKHVREQYVKLRRSALVLQAAYRGLRVRRMLKKQHNAATIIQSHFRKTRQQQFYRKIQWAVRVIQIRYKANNLKKAEVQCGEACIQGILCRPCKRKHQAAIVLQQHFKMQRERRKYLAFKSATIVFQRRYRALILGRRQRQEYVFLRSAVVCMQSFYRGAKARKLVRCLHLAATIIQATFRMHRARQSYQKVRGAIITIQRYSRSYLKGRHQRKIYLAIRKSAVKLQATFRGVRTRREIKAMHVSATLIQSFYRMHVQQKHYNIICWAVITIQSAYRGAVARKIAKETRARGEAQSFLCTAVDYRDHIQLRNATKELQIQDCMDKSIEQFQKYCEAACLIQQQYRSYLSMKCQRLAYLRTLKNIIIVQATIRSFIERRRFTRLRRSVIIIQSWYRAKYQRRRYLQYREKVIKIQRMLRKWMSCRNVVASANEKSMSQQTTLSGITKFQALWRGYLCRKKNDSAEIRAVRNSLIIANTESREEKKLCNRTTFAIDCLLKYKHFSYILAALKDLETVTRLSSVCCESLAQSEAVVTIFTLIRSCNRSIPCVDVIRYSVQILLNLSKYERTTEAVYAVENSVDTLLDLLQMYREKAGDKISEKGQSIFIKICCLFVLLSKDSRRTSEIRSNPHVVARLQSLFKLTARKHEMDARRMLAKRKSCAFINGYSSVLVTPGVSRKRPDWTLRKDNIQEIVDPLQAIKVVMDTLGISSY